MKNGKGPNIRTSKKSNSGKQKNGKGPNVRTSKNSNSGKKQVKASKSKIASGQGSRKASGKGKVKATGSGKSAEKTKVISFVIFLSISIYL